MRLLKCVSPTFYHLTSLPFPSLCRPHRTFWVLCNGFFGQIRPQSGLSTVRLLCPRPDSPADPSFSCPDEVESSAGKNWLLMSVVVTDVSLEPAALYFVQIFFFLFDYSSVEMRPAVKGEPLAGGGDIWIRNEKSVFRLERFLHGKEVGTVRCRWPN